MTERLCDLTEILIELLLIKLEMELVGGDRLQFERKYIQTEKAFRVLLER